ncbi:hypothetical protein P4H39_01340 [Paenibacillus lautus]|uniref:hypothetical protein n=1 Tax=Paenibacillus lautus TaxID=1401 RepID=UPI002DB9FA9C|nr:hypothetical protein [Paenibacillus lautus]MEC0201267.1 hypothetical protein [Paenibacillus lautus]
MRELEHEVKRAQRGDREAFKAYKSLSTLQKPKYFKTWVIRILINECNQLLRSRERTVVMAEVPERIRN